ncbi:Cytochrome P450, E-class, group I,Cytochrome P450,Cytochrome P450, conserved site [Cinara cedri]|uniref:Cytochrome P450, E-class, group I,Cytochrome P450,Cytochrome P450, conserved site n=1 Tax=Cinara cedri TaxID=506608 RepID=A0A5E4NQP5_9HEMI|nr:Cytochrome P450, E-class, group I,Cytochrome P450,Cytochrome P450, conserved site [Cinara cedri]
MVDNNFVENLDLLQFTMDIIKNNGPIVHFNLAGQSNVLLNDPEDLKILLSSSSNINKGSDYDTLKPWLNEGLLLSTGSKWQYRRKLLTNTFHMKTLAMYVPSLNRHSRVLVDKLLHASRNEEISIKEYITLCSLDMLCETIIGTEMKAQEGESVQYVNSINSACRSAVDQMFKFWLWIDVVFRMSSTGRTYFKSIKVLHDYTARVIKNKKTSMDKSKSPSEEKKHRKSFLDLLLDASRNETVPMTDQDIREEVDTFLFEGHDTTSTSMTITLILLAMHRDIQNKAREELRSIFGDSDRDATTEDLNAMKYLEAIIKESLRLYPSVPFISRELQTTLNLKNYSIPPKTTIIVTPYVLHRNEDIYPNAEEFVPERFLDMNNKDKFLFGYLPFSAGPRNCIGQKFAMYQMKSVISTILRKAKIETSATKKDIKISAELVIRLVSPIKLKFYEL